MILAEILSKVTTEEDYIAIQEAEEKAETAASYYVLIIFLALLVIFGIVFLLHMIKSRAKTKTCLMGVCSIITLISGTLYEVSVINAELGYIREVGSFKHLFLTFNTNIDYFYSFQYNVFETIVLIILAVASILAVFAPFINRWLAVVFNALGSLSILCFICTLKIIPIGTIISCLFFAGAAVSSAFWGRGKRKVKDQSQIPIQPEQPVKALQSTAVNDLDIIKKYKELLDIGAITQEEFKAKKSEILNQPINK